MANTFNVQSANEVFASPDGVNGEPCFRVLTANDLPSSLLSPSVNLNPANTTNVETYFTPEFEIPANHIQAGSVFKLTIATDAINVPTNDSNNLNIRLGANGNTSDQSIWGQPLSLGGAGSPGTVTGEFLVTFYTAGANANVRITPLSWYSLQDEYSSYNGPLTSAQTQINTESVLYLGASYTSVSYPTEWNIALIQQIA